MSRAQLNADILALELELALRRGQLRVSGRQHIEYLRSVPPVFLLSGGAAAGLVSGLLASCCGTQFYTVCRNSIRLWRTAGLLLPAALGPELASAEGIVAAP